MPGQPIIENSRRRHRPVIVRALGVVLASVSVLIAWETVRMNRRRTHADFYVAPTGSDEHPGTLRQPFATLERARDAVREQVAAGLDADVRVLLREGTYYMPEGLTFGLKDSGTEDHSITYAAYPDEVPLLVGGLRAEGWTTYRGGIWQADIPSGVTPNQVFENGRRLDLARAPNEGYLSIAQPVKGQEKWSFVYRAGDLDPQHWDITDARVLIWPGHDWFSQDKGIVRIDPEARVVTMDSTEGYDMKPGNRYFVKNVLALLDRSGECQISLKDGKVFVWPTQVPIDNQVIVLATARNVLAVRGTGGRPVRNLHFEGLDISASSGDAVRMSGAENCSIRYSTIENAQERGILIDGYAQHITVYGNLVRWNGWHGIELKGLDPGQPDLNHHNTVESNHVHHCGQLVGHGYGIRIEQSGHNRILHNHIHHMPRYGTTIKGTRYQVLRQQVRNVTWENHYDFLHSRDNLIAYNHIHHVNLDSQDTGAMESWGPGRDNVYDHNLIHNVGNTQFDLQSGIYLDDASDHFAVTNNIIYGVIGTGHDQCIYAKGIGNVIDNNVLVVAPTNRGAISSFFMADERCDHHQYTRNIILFEERTGAGSIYQFTNWSDDRIAESDHNVFWSPGNPIVTVGGPAGGDLRKWFDLGRYDTHSLVADPMFIDPERSDYRLKADSPALELGFSPIDTSQIGLKRDFPGRFERE